MNNQRKWLIGIIVLLVLMNVTILIFFWSGKRPPSPSRISNHFVKELNLSDVQAEKFETLFETHFEENRTLMDSSMFYKEKMFEMLVQVDREEVELKKLIQKSSALEAKKDEALIAHYIQLEKACETEEQKKKLQELFIRSIPKHRRGERR